MYCPRAGCRPRQGNPAARHGYAAQDAPASAVRDYRADSASVAAWFDKAHLALGQYLFPSRVAKSPHLSTRQYARIVARWVESIGLDASAYGTHTMRRTKATLIYRRTKNLRAVELLLGHTKLESTVLYLGIEVDDALEIAEQAEV